jgi:DNA-binding MarR family transcriptional regulator
VKARLVDLPGRVVHMHDMTFDISSARLAQNLLDNCMCHKARMASRAITRAYDDALRPTGLRATQVSVLAAVGAHGALSIQSLADSLGMDRTTLTRNLKPLEDKGLVVLAPEARHRSRMLALAPSGHAILREALPRWERAQRTAQKRLGSRNWREVQKALADLTGSADPSPAT